MNIRTDVPIDDLRQPPPLGKSLYVLFGLVAVTFLAPAVGGFFPPDDWYAALRKPDSVVPILDEGHS
ncbi:MAG: hypothetical protein WD030_03905 [Pirellulales bacterium]